MFFNLQGTLTSLKFSDQRTSSARHDWRRNITFSVYIIIYSQVNCHIALFNTYGY